MTRVRLLSAIALVLTGTLLSAAEPAPAEPLKPLNLHVDGGEAWHAENWFRLDWVRSGGVPATIGYQLRAGLDPVQPAVRLAWGGDSIGRLRVPAPGQYTVELWLEDQAGNRGDSAFTTLRFDDRAPNSARVLPPPGWFGAGSQTAVRIEHPAAPQPLSGIRGYALSVDRGAGAPPCHLAVCTDAETDLRGGIDGDTMSLGILPEGLSTVYVVAVSAAGVHSTSVGATVVRVDLSPPVVDLEGVPAGWARGPVRLTATATDPLSGVVDSGPNGPFTAIAVDGGLARASSGPKTATVVSGDGSHRVSYFARDAAGNNGEESGSSTPPPTTLVRIDEAAPRVGFEGTRDPADPERIEATVSDPLSGPSPSRGTIEVRPAGSRAHFDPIPTAATAGHLVGRWDSDAYPAGSYEFRVTGYDAAGNATATDRRADGARMVLANPVKVPTLLRIGFGGKRLAWHRCVRAGGRRHCHREVIEPFDRRPPRRSIPYGRATWLGGRLVTAAGAPLAGAAVQVVERFDAGGQRPRTTTVETDGEGIFLAGLSSGPDRQVEATFAGNRVLTRAGSRAVRLEVLSGVSLRASWPVADVGGAPVVFNGRVSHRGAAVPATGLAVQLQFRLSGLPWTEFRTVQTDAGGQFRYPYRFSDDDSRGIRFQFRALVPAQGGWPYEAGTSRPVAVTGR